MCSCTGNGGEGVREEDRRTTISRPSGTVSLGGSIFYQESPPPSNNFQVLPESQFGSETPGTGAPGRAELGAAIQASAGARRRRAVS